MYVCVCVCVCLCVCVCVCLCVWDVLKGGMCHDLTSLHLFLPLLPLFRCSFRYAETPPHCQDSVRILSAFCQDSVSICQRSVSKARFLCRAQTLLGCLSATPDSLSLSPPFFLSFFLSLSSAPFALTAAVTQE